MNHSPPLVVADYILPSLHLLFLLPSVHTSVHTSLKTWSVFFSAVGSGFGILYNGIHSMLMVWHHFSLKYALCIFKKPQGDCYGSLHQIFKLKLNSEYVGCSYHPKRSPFSLQHTLKWLKLEQRKDSMLDDMRAIMNMCLRHSKLCSFDQRYES